MRIAIVGGRGQVARHMHPILVRAGHVPVALVRKEAYRAKLEDMGAEVRLLDIESEEADAFAAAFEACDAVVFAAGGGPDGNAERKRTVDLEGSLKSMQGPRQLDIGRLVQVSAINVDDPLPAGPARCGERTSRRSATLTPRCVTAAWAGRSFGQVGSPMTQEPALCAGPDIPVVTSRVPTWPRC